MNIKQLATNFDVLYRRVNDRSKVTEVMLAQLAERSEAEEKYHKALEKISGQMQNGGGDIDDLVKGVKIDLNQRAQYYKQFNVSYKHDVETSINELKTIQTQFKPLIQEVLKLDKEIKITFDKYERQKDKTLRACKDYEEAAITLEAQCWNKECNAEQRAKALHRLNQQLVYKQENESQLRQASTLYNNSVAQYGSQLTTGITSLQSFYGKLFAIAKDIVMKILVYEISKTRNLQYDSEQFFKEAEKYLDPQTDPLAPGPSSQIGIAKENYYKVNPQLNSSFLRNISDQISISHRLNTKRETASSQLIEHFDQFDLMLTNPQLIDDLKGVTINLIGKVNNKNKPKNPEDQQPAGVQSVVNKYKGQYGEATLLKVFSFIKYVIQMTQEQQIKGWKNIPVLENNNLDEIFDCKFYRELGTIIIESFRQAGCSNMSQYGFKNMVAFTSKLLEISQKEGELLLVKRIITMISTIYTLDQQEKRFFLQDSLISMAIWKQIDLWEGLIYTTIEAEIDKSALREGTQFSNEQIFKDKNVIYSNLLSLTLNMINFKVDKTEIKNVLTKYARVFQLFELQAQELLKFADNDGKIEPNSKVNSLSVLQTLYYQPQSNIQQGANVQKKVVIFDKKNPLGNTITVAKPTGTQVYFTADTPVKEQPSPAVQQPHQQSNQTPAQNPSIQQQSQAQPPQQQPPQQQPPQQQPPQQQPPQQQPPQQQPPQQAPQPQQQPPPQPTKTITTGNSPILQQVQTTSPQVTQEQDQPKIRYNQHPLEAPKPNFLKKLP